MFIYDSSKFFLRTLNDLNLATTLSGLVVQDIRRKRTASQMERKITSVDLQQENTGQGCRVISGKAQ